MKNETQEGVVTRADRDAMVDLAKANAALSGIPLKLLRSTFDLMLAGEFDSSPEAKILARHRLQSNQPAAEGLVEEAAKRIHEAMVWATEQPGPAQDWQGGNSFAEDKARRTAVRIAALSTPPTDALFAENAKNSPPTDDALVEALEFYADPETYHAIAFRGDRPCGAFADDFDDHHGHEEYDRPMPGSKARTALAARKAQGEGK